MMNKNSNRKPFGDLTNKLSAVSLSDGAGDGITPRPRKNFPESFISKISQENPGRPETKVEPVAPLQSRVKSPDSSTSASIRSSDKAAAVVRRRPNIINNYGSISPSGDHLETISEETEDTSSVRSSLSADTSPFYPKTGLYPVAPPSSPSEPSVAYVMEPGYISFRMSHGVVLDISNDLSVRLHNPGQQSSIAMSGDSHHVAILHPQGRALVYQPRVEVQVSDHLSVKNAKFYSKGISFTANNLALVYLLDEAGARSTADIFHDLLGTNIVEILFKERCGSQQNSVSTSCQQLDRTRYWRNQVKWLRPWLVRSDLFCSE